MWTLLAVALAQQPVTVAFEGPGVTVGLVQDRSANVVVARELCQAPCVVSLEPGEYDLYAQAPGTFVRPKPILVDGPLVLEARRSVVRDTGLGLIAGGLAAAAIGGVGFGLNGVDGSAETALTGAFVTGLGAAAIGVPLTLTGKGRWRAAPASPAVP